MIKQQLKDHVLEFYVKSASLHELMQILKEICLHMDFNSLNPNLKYFKQFRFIFFGLMVKTNSLLDTMVYKCEFLKDQIKNDSLMYIFLDISRLKKQMDEAYVLVYHKKLFEGKNKIISIAESYEKSYDDIKKALLRVII